MRYGLGYRAFVRCREAAARRHLGFFIFSDSLCTFHRAGLVRIPSRIAREALGDPREGGRSAVFLSSK